MSGLERIGEIGRIWPSQPSCLGSLVSKNIAWKADGRGFESHLRQPIFLCFGQVVLCCFAFLLCCFVALPFSASLGVIAHICACITVPAVWLSNLACGAVGKSLPLFWQRTEYPN